MAMQLNPVVVQKQIEDAKIQQRAQQAELEQNAKMAGVAVDKQNADTNFLKTLADIQSDDVQDIIEAEKIDAENARTAVELSMSVAKSQRELLRSADDEGEQ
jgi:hypothetical protein